MKDFDINDYKEQLQQVCLSCKKSKKCKDQTKICLAKKLVFNISKVVYKKRQKESK